MNDFSIAKCTHGCPRQQIECKALEQIILLCGTLTRILVTTLGVQLSVISNPYRVYSPLPFLSRVTVRRLSVVHNTEASSHPIYATIRMPYHFSSVRPILRSRSHRHESRCRHPCEQRFRRSAQTRRKTWRTHLLPPQSPIGRRKDIRFIDTPSLTHRHQPMDPRRTHRNGIRAETGHLVSPYRLSITSHSFRQTRAATSTSHSL